jgi:hypothetical protein
VHAKDYWPSHQTSDVVSDNAQSTKSEGFHWHAAGIGAVRCKWGNTQEATALFELMHALPEGSLEEVGLCMVDPVVLQERYGFAPGRLPPMGATPDGLMRQRHSSPAASVGLLATMSGFFGP